MSQFLDFLARQRAGLAVLFAFLLLLVLLAQWLAWIFRLGRFKVPPGTQPEERTSQLRFVIADFFVKVIDDFRHLLALLILLIFAVILGAVLVWAPTFKDVKDGLQAVVAALGGLVGSIIGYYFGESAAIKGQAAGGQPAPIAGAVPPATQPAVQNQSAAPDILPAPLPPGL